MKLTFKDLKQQKFIIEAEPSETIAQLKEKISSEKGWEPQTQKLIFSGKILQDENTIESYNIEEKGFIVCMTTKPKVVASKPAEPSTPAKPVSTPAVPAAPAQSSTSSTTQPPATPSPAPGAAATAGGAFNDPNALAIGDQRNAAIANMEAMGFPRDQIDRAMRAAFFNPDRAVEYLLTGIPESAPQEQRPAATPTGAAAPAQQQQPQQQPQQTSGTSAPSAPSGDEPINLFEQAAAQQGGGRGAARGAGGLAGAGLGSGGAAGAGQTDTSSLDFLRNNPQFQQLRQVVQQQPAMLEPILQQVAAGNPQLGNLIMQNQQAFMELLAEDTGDDDVQLPPGAVHEIPVTEEERDAIERLCRLGFDRNMAMQAYFACDKNEELAANFLFDQPDEPDEQ